MEESFSEKNSATLQSYQMQSQRGNLIFGRERLFRNIEGILYGVRGIDYSTIFAEGNENYWK